MGIILGPELQARIRNKKIQAGVPISKYSFKDLPQSLMSNPAITAPPTEKMWIMTSMLCRYLESFIDNMIIIQDDKPIGILGGKETLFGLLKNPTFEFFDQVTAGEVMGGFSNVVTSKTTLSDLISMMQHQRTGFAVIPNDSRWYSKWYSAISVRTLLEVSALSKTDMKTSEIPKKNIITFTKEDTMDYILTSMFHTQTRRLVLEDYSSFISDRLILEKIAFKLNYLNGVSNFLEIKAGTFPLKRLEKISEDLPIPELAKKMLSMNVPYVMTQDRIISPWDIAIILR